MSNRFFRSVFSNDRPNTYSSLISKFAVLTVSVLLFIIYYCLSSLFKTTSPQVYILSLNMSFFALCGVIYFLFQEQISTYSKDSLCMSSKNMKTMELIFYISFFMSIFFIFLILANTLYVKPTSYYLFISFAAVSIGLQIGFCQDFHKKSIFFILLEILILATIIRSSSLFLTPFHIGVDTHYFHYPKILNILETGYISREAFYYYYYPSYHLTQSVIGLITGFSINSFKLVHLCNSLVLIPIAYLIGSYLHNEKAGLICALLFSLATMNIFFVLFSTSKVGGATLIFLVLFLLLKMINSNNIRYLLLFFVCVFSLFLWHPEIDAVLFFIMLSYFLIKIFYRSTLKFDSLFIVYMVFYLAYNIYISTFLFNKIVQSIFFINIDSNSPLIHEFLGDSISFAYISQTFVAYIGIALPMFFVSYSFFSWMRRRDSDKDFLMFAMFFLCTTPVFGVFTSNISLNPTRLLSYISLISLIISSCSIFFIFNFKKKICIASFILFLFAFSLFSTSSYIAADGNEFYNDNISVGLIYTTRANVAANTFINSKLPHSSIINTDPTTFDVSNPHIKAIRSQDFNSTGYFLVNNYNIKRLNLVFDESFILSKKNKVYTSDFNSLNIVT